MQLKCILQNYAQEENQVHIINSRLTLQFAQKICRCYQNWQHVLYDGLSIAVLSYKIRTWAFKDNCHGAKDKKLSGVGRSFAPQTDLCKQKTFLSCDSLISAAPKTLAGSTAGWGNCSNLWFFFQKDHKIQPIPFHSSVTSLFGMGPSQYVMLHMHTCDYNALNMFYIYLKTGIINFHSLSPWL